MTTLVEATPGSGIMIPQQYAFKSSQGGMQAIRTAGGWILVNLNKEMKQVRLKTEHIDWLILKYPHLAVLVRNGETLRRAQAMVSRLEAIKNNPNVINLESIDPDRANLSGIDAKDSTTILRGVTYVDMGVDPPVRRFLFSEFEVSKTFRVDEAAVQYALAGDELKDAKAGKLGRFLTEAELKDLKAGKTLQQLGKLRDAQDLRVHVLDLNRPVSGDAMVKHYTKLIDTNKALLEDLVVKFGLVPKGVVSLSLREVYLEAAGIYMSDKPAPKGAAEKVVRHGTAGGAKSPLINELCVKVTVTPHPHGAIVNVLPNTSVRRFMDVSPDDLKRLVKAANDFLPQIALAFAKVK